MSTESEPHADPRRILLFVRAPQRGRVKTRLAARLGADITLALYRCFVADILATLKAGAYRTTVFYTPDGRGSDVQTWLGGDVRCRPQTGADLGQRMQRAFRQTFGESVKQAVLIGSDFPDLDIGIMHAAFGALRDSDVVVGPAADGGYYLIGFRKSGFRHNLFDRVDWGTRRVFQQTMAQIEKSNLKSHILPTWRDIDTYEDLTTFYARNANRKPRLKTMTYLSEIMERPR